MFPWSDFALRLQWSAMILRLSLAGRLMTAGPWASTIWNLVFSHLDCWNVHGKLQVQREGTLVPLYVVSLMSRVALATSWCRRPFLSSLFGYLLMQKTIPVQLVKEHLPEGCQWEGVALHPSVHHQDQIVDAWSAGELDADSHKDLISRWLHGWHPDVIAGQHIKVWVIICLVSLNVVDLFGS